MGHKHIHKNRSVVAVDKATMKVIRRYPNMKAAAKDAGVCLSTMQWHLAHKSLFPDFAAFRFEDEYDANEQYKQHMKNRPVLCKSASEETVFANTSEAAEATGLTVSAVVDAIGQRKRRGGCLFWYAR